MSILRNDIFGLSITKKICLSGLFIALVVIFNKVIALNYIPLIPFVRISFGSIALLVFASIVMGPLYGLVIGAAADVMGYFIFDASSFGWFPQITLTYALLGFLPFFIYKLVLLITNKKVMMIVEYGFMGLVLAGLTLFLAFNNSIVLYGTTYNFELYQKILIPCIGLLLCALIAVVNFIVDKKTKVEVPLNIYQISFIVFLTEILVNLLFGSLMKAWAFGWNMFLAIFIAQAILMFFNIPYNSYLVYVTMRISKNYIAR